jgi:F420-non-reducing hydrogenase large subunit
MTTTVTLDPVTRIEGHAKITLDCDDSDSVIRAHLHVLELRGFEKLVEGMECAKMPLITGRICGVCPAAHHLASVIAIEHGCGTVIPEEAHLLRSLLYMGHILHSHALSCFILTGPDLFSKETTGNQRSIFRMLADNPDLSKKALRLRSIGQKIVEKVGGRGIHPVTALPGGMSHHPGPEDMATMLGWGKEALDLLDSLYPVMTEKLSELASLRETTALSQQTVALSHCGTVSYLEGDATVQNAEGGTTDTFTADNYDQFLTEHIMPGSYMKSVRFVNGGSYFVGPLARLLVNDHFTTPKADALLAEFKKESADRRTAFDAIEARCIEMVHCAERIVALCTASVPDVPLQVPVSIGKGTFRSMIEAPRGILIHDYTTDDRGRIAAANLIVATQNNYDAIDATITALARNCKTTGDEENLFSAMEFGIRCFDPCLSCATHVAGRMGIRIELRRNDTVFRTLTRGVCS